MTNIQQTYYQNVILSLHCKVDKGVLNPAKPLLVLSIIELIEKNPTQENRFEFDGDCKAFFSSNCNKYQCSSPYYYPFYYLEHDGFWHLHWKENSILACKSAKYIRDKVEYAFLDDSLWELWTDAKVRSLFKNLIIDKYLSNNKNTQ